MSYGRAPRGALRRYGSLGDVPTCPPGTALQNGLCVQQTTVFQRIGAALTGFFSPSPSTLPPGTVAPPTSFTQSPMFVPALIGAGVLAVVILKKTRK